MSYCFYNFYNSKVKKNIQLRWEDFYNMGTLAAAAK